ncbi:hypothetical protein lerEdw1_019223 [Lerista edwardsae]|nr:hypothetical protein lerEdw1_019223 [Lerista edwardsae]
MAGKPSDHPEPLHTSRINSISSQFSDGPVPSPSARSSTSSWCEEPVQSNMDISTGHMILSYMEDHLKNKNRLEKEWEALCAYQAEPNAATTARRAENAPKNRSQEVLAYDHCRIRLKAENSYDSSDYINASPIMDHDPRNPAYIAAQGPLTSTVTDFWQMVWENGCVVIVMLTPLAENGVKQCYHYWPDEGSNLYHIYEVNLVSEHIWCEDFLVRSFYLKNLQSNETRTVTQFHFLTWHDQKVPASTQSLLDFRRNCSYAKQLSSKVHWSSTTSVECANHGADYTEGLPKARFAQGYFVFNTANAAVPLGKHDKSKQVLQGAFLSSNCSLQASTILIDGAGRSGTYILIDMVLNKMAKAEAGQRHASRTGGVSAPACLAPRQRRKEGERQPRSPLPSLRGGGWTVSKWAGSPEGIQESEIDRCSAYYQRFELGPVADSCFLFAGAKEIDIAATLEHLRDQRPGMVQTKEQFEFALTAVAEEVNAILKALPQ